MPPAVVAPPPTQTEPITETLHGVEVTDPYRWLEDQNSPRTRKWIEEQTAYTKAYFDAISGRERIRERVAEFLAVQLVSEPWKVGNRYFFLKREAHQQQPAIVMREGEAGDEIVLVDPTRRNEGYITSVNIVTISRDGSLLAYGVRHRGSDAQSAEFLDVGERTILPDRLPLGFGPALVFSSDGDGFFYVHEVVNSARPDYRALYWHRFGDDPGDDGEIFAAGEDPNLHLALLGSADGSLLACLVVTSNDPFRFDLHVRDLASDRQFQKIFDGIDVIVSMDLVGRMLVALTKLKAPNLRIVAIDLAHPESTHWVEIVPETRQRIRDFAVVGNFVCVLYEENFTNRIEIHGLSGRHHDTVICPEGGAVRLLYGLKDSDTLFYNFSSFDQPRTIFSYCVSNQESKVWSKTSPTFDTSSVAIDQVKFGSKDSTDVPMFLVHLRDRPRSGRLPVFLTGYGGFGAVTTPQFSVFLAFLVEHGFLVAIANVRGGGELGEAWHDAGKRQNRQNAINDFIAAAEWLLARGYTVPGKIAIGGGSNAGLLMGAALTQRPDLFQAVLCLGPLLDMLRYHLFDFADQYVDEYGASTKPEDFFHLLAYSPYHHVEKGVAYPAVMLVSGDADTRCNPMHSRKMTARLQAATSSDNPILLDYKPTWGHVPVQSLNQRIDTVTDRLAFICKELKVSV